MNILVTGSAGFIGFHLCLYILSKKNKNINLIGIDNINNYYDVDLKKKRLNILKKFKKFIFHKTNITNYNNLDKIYKNYQITHVINLAAQAGVRYSIDNAKAYFDSNLHGFFNILEISKKYKIKHLITASTSSVYGNKSSFPIKEEDNTNKPLSFYAATKKSNEIMAYSYSNIYKLPITCLRFFTVYGPYGRPDMFLYKYVEAVQSSKTIKLYNSGNHIRDFTYIDDVIKSIYLLIKKYPKRKENYQILNIGNGKPILLKEFIKEINKNVRKKPKTKKVKLQKGDVFKTHASINKLKKLVKFKPNTNHKKGIKNFVDWYEKK